MPFFLLFLPDADNFGLLVVLFDCHERISNHFLTGRGSRTCVVITNVLFTTVGRGRF